MASAARIASDAGSKSTQSRKSHAHSRRGRGWQGEYASAKAVDVNRWGYYSTLWEPYEDIKAAPPIKRTFLQASDHHCLWTDLVF